MHVIRVGDPHVTLSNIKEAQSLVDFIILKAKEFQADRVEFMGDLFHTHAVKRLEIEKFWHNAFVAITQAGYPIVALVGNHDQVGKGNEDFNALHTLSYIPNVTIVQDAIKLNNITYIGYHRDSDVLIKKANQQHSKCLIAHATFTGATYENGFYAEDGIDPDLFVHEEIISGHIHSSQQVGKCFYIGTPKWDTLSDANQDKGIWYFRHSDDGAVMEKEFISTKEVVLPIMKYTINEGESLPEINPEHKNYIELVGQSAWILKMKKKIKGMAQIKGRPTDRISQSRTNDNGEMLSINQYLSDFFIPQAGVDKNSILEYINSVEVKNGK